MLLLLLLGRFSSIVREQLHSMKVFGCLFKHSCAKRERTLWTIGNTYSSSGRRSSRSTRRRFWCFIHSAHYAKETLYPAARGGMVGAVRCGQEQNQNQRDELELWMLCCCCCVDGRETQLMWISTHHTLTQPAAAAILSEPKKNQSEAKPPGWTNTDLLGACSTRNEERPATQHQI